MTECAWSRVKKKRETRRWTQQTPDKKKDSEIWYLVCAGVLRGRRRQEKKSLTQVLAVKKTEWAPSYLSGLFCAAEAHAAVRKAGLNGLCSALDSLGGGGGLDFLCQTLINLSPWRKHNSFVMTPEAKGTGYVKEAGWHILRSDSAASPRPPCVNAGKPEHGATFTTQLLERNPNGPELRKQSRHATKRGANFD